MPPQTKMSREHNHLPSDEAGPGASRDAQEEMKVSNAFDVNDVPFSLIVQALTAIEQKPKQRRAIVMKLFDKTIRRDPTVDAYPLMRLLLPLRDIRIYGIREAMLAKLFAEAIGVPANAGSADYIALTEYKRPTDAIGVGASSRRQGDFSLALEEVVARRQAGSWLSKGSEFRHTVGTINEVLNGLSRASTTYAGPTNQSADTSQTSSAARVRLLRDQVFLKLTPVEHKWFARIILKDLKIGGQDSILKLFHPDALELFNSTGSLEDVCKEVSKQARLGLNTSPRARESEEAMDENGLEGELGAERKDNTGMHDLKSSGKRRFAPFTRPQPMLCALETEWRGVLKSLHYKPFVVQDKFDGERILIHMDLDSPAYAPSTQQLEKVQISTRRSKDYTSKYGPVFSHIIESVFGQNCRSVVLDGEMLAYNRKLKRIEAFGNNRSIALLFGSGDPRPTTTSSRTTNLQINAEDYNLCYVIFDLLYVDGRDISHEPYHFRRTTLQRLMHNPKTGEPLTIPTVLELCPETIFIPIPWLSANSRAMLTRHLTSSGYTPDPNAKDANFMDNHMHDLIAVLPNADVPAHLAPEFVGQSRAIVQMTHPAILTSLPNDIGCGVSHAPSTHGLRPGSSQSKTSTGSHPIVAQKRVMLASYTSLKAMLQDAISRNMEGLVAKELDSPYSFGKRGPLWVKIKPDHLGLSDDIDVLVVGGYFGEGRRGGDIASFLLGVRADEPSQDERLRRSRDDSNSMPQAVLPKYYTFTKVGSGFSDIEIKAIRDRLRPYWFESSTPPDFVLMGTSGSQFEPPDVWVLPNHSIVFEVRFYELKNDSDTQSARITARFPRFIRWRDDKPWWDASSLAQLKTALARQQRIRRVADGSRHAAERPGVNEGSDDEQGDEKDRNLGDSEAEVDVDWTHRRRMANHEYDSLGSKREREYAVAPHSDADTIANRRSKKMALDELFPGKRPEPRSEALDDEPHMDEEQKLIHQLFGLPDSKSSRSETPFQAHQPMDDSFSRPIASPVNYPQPTASSIERRASSRLGHNNTPSESYSSDASKSRASNLEGELQQMLAMARSKESFTTTPNKRQQGAKRGKSPAAPVLADFRPIDLDETFRGGGILPVAKFQERKDDNDFSFDDADDMPRPKHLPPVSQSSRNPHLPHLPQLVARAMELAPEERTSVRERTLTLARRALLRQAGLMVVDEDTPSRSLDDIVTRHPRHDVRSPTEDFIAILNGVPAKQITARTSSGVLSNQKESKQVPKPNAKIDLAKEFDKFLRSNAGLVKTEIDAASEDTLRGLPQLDSIISSSPPAPFSPPLKQLTDLAALPKTTPIKPPTLVRLRSDVWDEVGEPAHEGEICAHVDVRASEGHEFMSDFSPLQSFGATQLSMPESSPVSASQLMTGSHFPSQSQPSHARDSGSSLMKLSQSPLRGKTASVLDKKQTSNASVVSNEKLSLRSLESSLVQLLEAKIDARLPTSAQSVMEQAFKVSSFYDGRGQVTEEKMPISRTPMTVHDTKTVIATNVFANFKFCVIGEFYVTIPPYFDIVNAKGDSLSLPNSGRSTTASVGKDADLVQLARISPDIPQWTPLRTPRIVKLTSRQLSTLIVSNGGNVLMSPPNLRQGEYSDEVLLVGEVATARLTPYLRPIWYSLPDAVKKDLEDAASAQGELARVGAVGTGILTAEEKLRVGQRNVVVGQWIIDSVACVRAAPLIPEYLVQATPTTFCLLKRQYDATGINYQAMPRRSLLSLRDTQQRPHGDSTRSLSDVSSGDPDTDVRSISHLVSQWCVPRRNSDMLGRCEPTRGVNSDGEDQIVTLVGSLLHSFKQFLTLSKLSGDPSVYSTLVVTDETDASTTLHVVQKEVDSMYVQDFNEVTETFLDQLFSRWNHRDFDDLIGFMLKFKSLVYVLLMHLTSSQSRNQGTARRALTVDEAQARLGVSNPMLHTILKAFLGASSESSEMLEVGERVGTKTNTDPFLDWVQNQKRCEELAGQCNRGVARLLGESLEKEALGVNSGFVLGTLSCIGSLFCPLRECAAEAYSSTPGEAPLAIITPTTASDCPTLMQPSKGVPTKASVYVRMLDDRGSQQMPTSAANSASSNRPAGDSSEQSLSRALSPRATVDDWTQALKARHPQSCTQAGPRSMVHLMLANASANERPVALLAALRSVLLLPLSQQLRNRCNQSGLRSPPSLAYAFLIVGSHIARQTYQGFAFAQQLRRNQGRSPLVDTLRTRSICGIFWIMTLCVAFDEVLRASQRSLSREFTQHFATWSVELSTWSTHISQAAVDSDVNLSQFPLTALAFEKGTLSSGARLLAIALHALPEALLTQLASELA